jgi:protein-disulfide isomerase
MDDYFDAVQVQLAALCAQRARRHGPSWLRLPALRRSGVVVLASALVTAAVFVFALGTLAGRPSSSGPRRNATAAVASPTARPALRVLAPMSGIPQSGRVLGALTAPVTVVFFGDLECPICRDFTLGAAFRRLVTHDVRSGRVKLEYDSLCTASCASGSEAFFDTQQMAAYAAGDQDRFWDYMLLFSAQQGVEGTRYVTARYLTGLARQVPGLDLNRWRRDRGRRGLLNQVRADARAAAVARIVATPTLVVQGPERRVTLVGDPGYPAIIAAIKRVRRPAANAVISDCISQGRLTHPYSRAQLDRALAVMPVAVRQYTNCAAVLTRARRHAR